MEPFSNLHLSSSLSQYSVFFLCSSSTWLIISEISSDTTNIDDGFTHSDVGALSLHKISQQYGKHSKIMDFPWPVGRQTKVSFLLRILFWCEESCKDDFCKLSSANSIESSKRQQLASIGLGSSANSMDPGSDRTQFGSRWFLAWANNHPWLAQMDTWLSCRWYLYCWHNTSSVVHLTPWILLHGFSANAFIWSRRCELIITAARPSPPFA